MLRNLLLLTILIGATLCSGATRGKASWYGIQHQGLRTASGTTFDRNAYTCASRTYPLGTWLIVRFHRKEVLVKVTDRGPWVEGRVLDLSERVARDIGLKSYGIGTVYIRTLEEIMHENRNRR